MRKIRNLFTILICCIVTLFATPIVSCAKGLGEIDFDCSEIPVLEPWVSYTFELSHYDPTKFTETTEVIIEYTFEPTVGDSEGLTIEDVKDECPLELIVQSWSDPDTPMVNATGGVWAKVAPYEWGDGYAKFSIDDMIAAYGTSDFSKVVLPSLGLRLLRGIRGKPNKQPILLRNVELPPVPLKCFLPMREYNPSFV